MVSVSSVVVLSVYGLFLVMMRVAGLMMAVVLSISVRKRRTWKRAVGVGS